MFSLKDGYIRNRTEWKSAGIRLPEYDADSVRKHTMREPRWVHFGSGNIFRSFLAPLQQELLQKGSAQTGIVAVESFDPEIIEKIYLPYGSLSLLVLMPPDGNLLKSVTASVAETVAADGEEGWKRLKEIAAFPSLQMLSFTVTEKGYSLRGADGALLPDVERDMRNGPAFPENLMAKTAALLYERYRAGKLPLAAVSMDNCSRNGERLRLSVLEIAKEWEKNGLAESGFTDYLLDSRKISFPWTMIDKITPRPSSVIASSLRKIGFADTEIVRTNRNTYIAPFVNAEVPQYLVVEDDFPNGRPPLEQSGVLFADRETVGRAERMKVCACLNPLHTALAVFGCLLGYRSISDEMRNRALKNLVLTIGRDEGLSAVEDPKILDPHEFLREVVEQRLPNPYIPDTPQRIACDTSQKIPVRFGGTIRAYCERPDLDVRSLRGIPFAVAGWLRYLLGTDDDGNTMDLSPDPMLPLLRKKLSGIIPGRPETSFAILKPILSDASLFGENLCTAGLAEKVESYFVEMLAGPHAVAKALEKHFGGEEKFEK